MFGRSILTNPYLWVALLSAQVAFGGFVGWKSYQLGKRACEASRAAQIEAEREAGKILDEARLKVARERDDLARKLEEAAYAEPVIVDRCLSPGRVYRLNQLDGN